VKRYFSAILFITFISSFAFSQQSVRDSLFAKLGTEKTDTAKIRLLNDIALTFEKENASRKVSYAREALQLAQKTGDKRGMANSYRILGDHYNDHSDFPEALKYYFMELKIREDLNDKKNQRILHNRIGIVYSYQKKNYEALKQFQIVAKFAEELGDKRTLASTYNNLGVVNKNLGKYKEATEYYEKSLAIFKELGFKEGIAATYSNIGIAKVQMGDTEGAMEYYLVAKKLFEELNDDRGLGGAYVNIGELYLTLGDLDLAEQQFNKAMVYSDKSGFRVNKRDAYDGLYKTYERKKDYKNAYTYYRAFTALRDSIVNEEGNKRIQDIEKRYETEKQEKQIEILKQKEEISKLSIEKQKEQLEKNRIGMWAIAGGGVLILILLIVLYNRYQLKQRANRELEEKRKEIQDSINYARHIQRAIFPNPQEILHSLQCFGLYKPRDIVSGDFYWFARQGGKVLIAAADCTGHGVPGAFMSMIGIDQLNHAVQEKQFTQPSLILSSLNKGIRRALKQGEQDSTSRDGMDIALCSFDFESGVLEYAGANRPLFLIRNGELKEVKPTKAAIGGWTEDGLEFENNSLHIQKGDTVYIFTDGYADQMGGDKGKKIMIKKFREILLSIQHLSMEKQEAELERIFSEWKGNREQVDDVLVIGIRV
jgi:serine phosphatase RsbU (regulator of sigma subunit)/Tfp pilus assembly protein PilF